MPRGMKDPRKLAETRTSKALKALHMVQRLANYEVISDEDFKKISAAIHNKLAQVDDAFDSRKSEDSPEFSIDELE